MKVRKILITDERKYALQKVETSAFDIAVCVSESVGGGESVYSPDPEIIAILDDGSGFTRIGHICDVAIFSTTMGETALLLRLESIFGRVEKVYEMLRDDREDAYGSFSIGSV